LLPLKDDIQSPRPPVATLILIAVVIGLAVSGWRPSLDDMPWPVAAIVASLLTAGVLQLAVNMLFLWLFGKSVEGSITPLGLIGVYVVGALAAAGAADVLGGDSIPATGGAGAIAAVIAAHCVLHPRARIICFVLIPFFFTFVLLPATVIAVVWFGLQALAPIGDTAGPAFPGDPGVTVAALAGGLALGAIVAGAVRWRGLARPVQPGQPAY
jgi:membrane associated rhomboid family serine protease